MKKIILMLPALVALAAISYAYYYQTDLELMGLIITYATLGSVLLLFLVG